MSEDRGMSHKRLSAKEFMVLGEEEAAVEFEIVEELDSLDANELILAAKAAEEDEATP